MPTYAYACTACDHRFEIVQSFKDDSLTECPECQGRLRKLFNAVGVVFKGSGFYRTDSRSSSSASTPAATSDAPKSDSGTKSGSASSASGSSSTGASGTSSSTATSTSGSAGSAA